MDRTCHRSLPRRLGLTLVLASAVMLQLGCERKPGDGPSTVMPPTNVRTPGAMGAEPGTGRVAPMQPGVGGTASTSPAPETSILVDDGVQGQRLPQAVGGATDDPRLLSKDRAEREAVQPDLRSDGPTGQQTGQQTGTAGGQQTGTAGGQQTGTAGGQQTGAAGGQQTAPGAQQPAQQR